MSPRFLHVLALMGALSCSACSSDTGRTGPAPVASVIVAPKLATIGTGDTRQLRATLKDSNGNTLRARAVAWTTSAPNIVTVGGVTGLASGAAAGRATITARSEGMSGSAVVTVQAPIASVTVTPGVSSILVGGTQKLTATAKDAVGNTLTGRHVVWTTSSAGIASVHELQGVVNGISTGPATITATSEGKTGGATVTVTLSTVCTGPPRLGCGLGLDQFALIPAGTFQMGSNNGTYGEKPVHSVTISHAFYMQKTEVTQGQWRAVMGTNPSYDTSCGDTCPVDNLSWDDTQSFLRKLNASMPQVTYRLPTEAEWEYSARAGTTGDTYGRLDAIAWYEANSGATPHPVGGKEANAWGLYDMIGNVAEWVSDWFGSYTRSSTTDPSGPVSGSVRVKRGVSWYFDARLARSAYRISGPPAIRYNGSGVRLARTP